MVTGSQPFQGATTATVFDALLNKTPPSARERNPKVPVELERIIGTLLEKDRARRYASAAELRADLQRVQTGSSPVAGHRTRAPLLTYALPAVAGLMLVVGGIFFWQQRTPAPPLTDQDVLVLADFVNTTGDPVFDGTLRQALAIQLEQSPFLKIMDDEQVRQALRLMSLSADTRVTNQIAHDVCVRDAAAATIGGSIDSLGSNYVLTLQAIACQDGATLAREQVQADGKEQVLKAVGTAATAMRAKLGESRASIQKLNRPLEQATSGSLEAVQSYTAGFAELSLGRFLAGGSTVQARHRARSEFRHGVSLISPPRTTMPGTSEPEAEYERKAFALIDRVSELERHTIAAGYYQSTGELDKAIDTYRAGIASYPRFWGFHNNLSMSYIDLGQFEEGLKEGLMATQLQPNAEPPYRRLMDAYMCLDRLDEAKAVAEKVGRQGIDGARIHQRFLEMAYIEGDEAAAARETQWFAGKPEEYLSLGLQAAHRNVLGQRRESHKLFTARGRVGVASRAAERGGGLRGSRCASRRAVGKLPDRARAGASGIGAGDVRRNGRGGRLVAETAEALSERHPLECGAPAGDSRRHRTPSRSARQERWTSWPRPRRTNARTRRPCTCGAWRICVCRRAWRPRPSSGRSWITRAPAGAAPGAFQIGDCTIPCLTWVSRVRTRSPVKRRRPVKSSRTSSHSGKTLTPTSRFSNKLGRNTPGSSKSVPAGFSGLGAFHDFHEPIGHQAVGGAVNGDRGFLVRASIRQNTCPDASLNQYVTHLTSYFAWTLRSA